MKRLKKRTCILLFIAFALFIFSILNIKTIRFEIRKIYFEEFLNQELINSETSEINIDFFEIDKTGEKECTEGINQAIRYAHRNNIEYIKFPKGKYLVNGDREHTQEGGIILQSNLTLDLNESIVIQKDSKSPYYCIIDINNVENVRVINGTISGDRENHDYNTIESSHQWGMGIEIKNATNIEIKNLEIVNATGDAIYITGNSQNVDISNCKLSECRRQGISIISGKNINIYQNEIYKISGNTPQSGIDLESNFDNESIENVKIYENVFYNFGNNIAIQLCRYIKNVEITHNSIQGKIICYNCYEEFVIKDNVIDNGGIDIQELYGWEIGNVSILNNKITNSYISIKDVNADELQFEGNELENTNVENNNINKETI